MTVGKGVLSLLAIFALALVAGFSGLRVDPPVPENKSATVAEAPVPRAATPELAYESILIKPGATLERILLGADIARAEITQVISTIRQLYNPNRLRAGDRLELKTDAHGRFRELLYAVAADRKVRVVRDSLDSYTASFLESRTETESHLVTGEIVSSLYEAVLATGEQPELIQNISDIFQWDIDFFIDPRVGDRFHVLFEKTFLVDSLSQQRSFIRYGAILSAAYIAGDRQYVAYAYKDGKDRYRYYDEDGKSFQKTFLKSPLNYRRISSYFSTGRRHPILKRVRAHTGVDYAAAKGTPVVASADGRVIHRGWLGGYGNCVKISHKNGGYVTLYGHLSRFARGLRVGAQVKQNQVIGFVGATGLATGPHLHYTMYQHGRPVNPLRIAPTSGKPLAADKLPAFAASRDALKQRLGLEDADASKIYAFAR